MEGGHVAAAVGAAAMKDEDPVHYQISAVAEFVGEVVHFLVQIVVVAEVVDDHFEEGQIVGHLLEDQIVAVEGMDDHLLGGQIAAVEAVVDHSLEGQTVAEGADDHLLEGQTDDVEGVDDRPLEGQTVADGVGDHLLDGQTAVEGADDRPLEGQT